MKLKIFQTTSVIQEVEVDVEFPLYYRYGGWGDGPSNSDVWARLTESGWETTVTENTEDYGVHKSWSVEVEKGDVATTVAMVLPDKRTGLSSSYSPTTAWEFDKHYDAAMATIYGAEK